MLRKSSFAAKALIFFNILVVIILMLLAAKQQPIWLDEQYSLFFAKTFSPSQLLIHYTIDANPGLYYLYLKVILFITQNLFVLRTVSSVLPSLLGLASLVWLSQVDRAKKYLLFAAPLLFLNPFLITMSWQARIYGFVIMLTCFFYVLWQRWLQTKNSKYFNLLTVLLCIATLVQYVFIWFTIVTIFFVMIKTKGQKKLWSVTMILVVFTEFAISSGLSFKQKFTHIAWIPAPSLATIASVYSTVVGLSNDYFSAHVHITLGDLVFDAILFLIVVLILKKAWNARKTLLKTQNMSFISLVLFGLIPPVGLLVVSLLFPVLSHTPLFYHFVPSISFLVPRVLISFVVISSLFGLELVSSKKALYFVPILACIWFVNSLQFSVLTPLVSPAESNFVKQTIQKYPTSLLFPSWLYIENVDPENPNSMTLLNSQIAISQPLEDQLSDAQAVCRTAAGKTIFAKKVITSSLDWETQKIGNQLSTCCIKIESDENFDQWSCPNFP